jgi:hypothetical protein
MSVQHPRHRLARTRFWSIAVIAITGAVFGSLLATPAAPVDARKPQPTATSVPPTATSVPPAGAGSGSWALTGNLTSPRVDHSETRLADGRVLVVGGSTAEIYNPTSGSWSATGSPNVARTRHTATRLADGRVLVAGGTSTGYDNPGIRSAEIYDPATGTFSNTGSMIDGRAGHTATRLADGRVLVVGEQIGLLARAEIYNPATGAWSATGSMSVARAFHTATLLNDGRVLVAGSGDESMFVTRRASAEIYNPTTGAWSPTGSMSIARAFHTATLLPDGRVLVAAGLGSSGWLASAEIYNPATGSWSLTGGLIGARYYHRAVLLASGQVLIVGGASVATAELYTPATGAWSSAGSLSEIHYHFTATLLANGQVLVAGGGQVSPGLTTELYTP